MPNWSAPPKCSNIPMELTAPWGPSAKFPVVLLPGLQPVGQPRLGHPLPGQRGLLGRVNVIPTACTPWGRAACSTMPSQP